MLCALTNAIVTCALEFLCRVTAASQQQGDIFRRPSLANYQLVSSQICCSPSSDFPYPPIPLTLPVYNSTPILLFSPLGIVVVFLPIISAALPLLSALWIPRGSASHSLDRPSQRGRCMYRPPVIPYPEVKAPLSLNQPYLSLI
jgi:hypothetical protein